MCPAAGLMVHRRQVVDSASSRLPATAVRGRPDATGSAELKFNLTRRWILRAVVAAVGTGGLVASGWWHRQLRMRLVPITDTERGIVAAVIDELIPRDEMPGAIDLRIDEWLIEKAEADRTIGRLVAEACHWLDRQGEMRHGRSFVYLASPERNAVLEAMATAGRGSIPSDGFRWLRDGVMERYYSLPVTWPQLGIAGPPQPAGFMDYDSRPG